MANNGENVQFAGGILLIIKAVVDINPHCTIKHEKQICCYFGSSYELNNLIDK